ncbi:MAG: ribose 5-phosphate isomerase B [Candidatus Omnitrophota bacterium]
MIYIGADHRGYRLKNKIKNFLTQKGFSVVDVGAFTDQKSSDYPKISFKVAQKVAQDRNAKGILICMTGIGNSIAANKVRGIRAALCYNKTAARLSRQHNDANVLVLGSKFVHPKEIMGIVSVWLKTEFEGQRHQRRVNQIKAIERKCAKA